MDHKGSAETVGVLALWMQSDKNRASQTTQSHRGVCVNPVSAPLARVGDVDLVSERLAVWNATLRDTNGAIVPRRRVEKHPMVVEGTWIFQVVGRMDDEAVVRADRDRRRTGKINKNGEEARGEGRKPTAKCH
jgi:hypothetical protein